MSMLENLLDANRAHFLFDSTVPELGVLSFTGSEGISRLYRFKIHLVSRDPEINFEDILSKPAMLTVRCGEGYRYYRCFYGIIARFSQYRSYAHHTEYVAELVPMVWLLTLRVQSRIFQKMSVDEIVRKVLTDAGFGSDDYKFSLEKKYPRREYCVQYRESDFDFISRLLEEEGIFYFFQHEMKKKKEVMVFGDSSSAYPDGVPEKEVMFKEQTGVLSSDIGYVYECQPQQEVVSTRVTLNDFNYERPDMLLWARKMGIGGKFLEAYGLKLEVYDYPGGYDERADGERLADVRMEEIDARHLGVTGKSNWRSLASGYRITLTNHYRNDLNREYLVTQVIHEATHGAVLPYGESGEGTSYINHFECIPSYVEFRPPRVTPRPTVKGPHTATVVGPEGEKIYFDELGRVKVRFHWDREKKKDEERSCWIRVSQGYAGAQHGIQFMPLIGDEVIVNFLEGDPDKPIITGRVYNGNNMPPLKPDDKIQNIIKTPYQHRLMLDDKGAYITLNTGGNEVLNMADGNKDKSDHGNNIKLSTADGHFMHLAEGKEIRGIVISTLKKNMVVLDDKEENITIKTTNGHIAVLDDKNKKIAITSTDGHSITIDDQGKNITAVDSSGQHRFKIDIGGKKLIISTDTGGIDMLAPAGTIKMQANQINAEATTDVKIKGLNVTSEASMAQKVKGTMVNVEGGAMTNIKGALVKIN